MFDWVTSRLHRRMIVGTAAGLLVAVLAFVLLFFGMYGAELRNERAEVATQVNRLLQTSLENAMLKRDLDGLRKIVAELGRQQNISQVIITQPDGEVRFSSQAQRIGQVLNANAPPSAATTLFTVDAQGRDILRSVNPVYNKAACTQCHGSLASNPINGILYIDYDAEILRQKARATILWLTGAGLLIALVNITGGWWFLRRFVLHPVSRLTETSEFLSQGNLNSRVDLPGKDEFAQLGNSFNTMAENLQANMRRLSESKAFLQSLIDAIPDGVRLIDENYQVRMTNRSYRDQLGLDEDQAIGYCYEAPHGRSEPCASTLIQCPVREIRQREEPIKLVHRHRHQDGSVLDVEIYASPMRAVLDDREQMWVVESIRNLQQDIRYSQEQKMSELGRLAAGVAHEIYNPLSSLRLAMHTLRQELPDAITRQDDIGSCLKIVDREVDKCIEITERMLKLSMPSSDDAELVNLSDCIGETLSLLRWEAENNNITLSNELTADVRALARDSDLRMVVLNLSLNAFHAMPNGGHFSVSARHVDGWVEVRFNDTGSGISEEDIKSIFQPFFSRRADGRKGVGLGLAISRNMIEKHKGVIEVESELGKGSCFIIRLPDPDADT